MEHQFKVLGYNTDKYYTFSSFGTPGKEEESHGNTM